MSSKRMKINELKEEASASSPLIEANLGTEENVEGKEKTDYNLNCHHIDDAVCSSAAEPKSKQEEWELEVPFQRFPATSCKEVWLGVYQKLDKQDKLPFSQACPEWHHLLAWKRTQLLFSEVRPELEKIMPREDLLEYRKMCQSWTEELDSRSAEIENLRAKMQRPVIQPFSSAESIQKFLDVMNKHPGNPFPERNISLEWETPIQEGNITSMRYWDNVSLLMERYGKHIYAAIIRVKNLRSSQNLLPRLQHCLIHMPNLQSLNISWKSSVNGKVSLPRLPYLETVVVSTINTAVAYAIIGSCCQSTSIRHLNFFEKNPARLKAFYSFSNLEGMTARISIEQLERFGNGELLPPLRTLYLDLTNARDYERVFRCLELFGGTLADVLISFKRVPVVANALPSLYTGYHTNLPKLERLFLRNYNGPLDFFIQLSSLKALLAFCYSEAPWDGCVVDYFGFQDRMYESNIWELIPSLRTLMLYSPHHEPKLRDYTRP